MIQSKGKQYANKQQPHSYKIFDKATGLYFPTKNGCNLHPNCLECTEHDCVKPTG